jgi:hypothetical protein
MEMNQENRTMGNIVTLCEKRYAEFTSDIAWREIIMEPQNVTTDALELIYQPINQEGRDAMKAIQAYINSKYEDHVYFYVNNDIDGLGNLVELNEEPIENSQIEG